MAEVGIAAAPLILAVVLLVGRRAPGWRAGGAAWVLAVALALVGPFAVAPSTLVAAALALIAMEVGIWVLVR